MNTIRNRGLWTIAILVLALAAMSPTFAQTVEVTSADPPSAAQGTTSLDVTISGSGFDSTAQVQFLVTGTTNPGGVTVKKVVVRGSKKLVATIDVSDSAVIANFDIEVTLSSGRKGKGTTLFSVQAKVSNGDPCAVPGLDFPAFIYWKDGGQQTQDVFVADSTGTCSRLVIAGVTAGGGGDAKFSYPVGGAGNVGRVVYRYYDGSTVSIAAVDFTVNGTSIAVAPRYTIVPAVLNMDGFELSFDGKTLYYSISTCVDGSPYPACSSNVYKLIIPEQIGQSGTLVVADSPYWFNGMSVNGNDTALYVVQRDTPPNSSERVARIDLEAVGTPATVIASGSSGYRVAAAGSTSAERFAYVEWMGASGLDCYQIKVGEWTGMNAVVTTLPRYGRYRLTWYGDNVLTKTYKPPSRRGDCQDTGMISRIGPESAEETPLVRGQDPEGR